MAIISHIPSLTDADKIIEPLALPLADPLGADIETKMANTFSTETGSIHAGTWETETGLSNWDFSDNGEVIYVLSGKMTVTREGEEPQEVGAGDLAVFPLGWKGTWNVTERLSKIYVIYKG